MNGYKNWEIINGRSFQELDFGSEGVNVYVDEQTYQETENRGHSPRWASCGDWKMPNAEAARQAVDEIYRSQSASIKDAARICEALGGVWFDRVPLMDAEIALNA